MSKWQMSSGLCEVIFSEYTSRCILQIVDHKEVLIAMEFIGVHQKESDHKLQHDVLFAKFTCMYIDTNVHFDEH